MSSSHSHSPIVVTHEEGHRFSVTIGEHHLMVDQPRRGGGEDAGPAPLELLGASLGACVAFYVHQFCAARAIPDEDMRVEVRQHSAIAPHRIGAFEVRVVLPPEIPDAMLSLIQRVATSCPAHNTLVRGADVSVRVETVVAAE